MKQSDNAPSAATEFTPYMSHESVQFTAQHSAQEQVTQDSPPSTGATVRANPQT